MLGVSMPTLRPAVFEQPAGSVGVQAGEVQLRDGLRSTRIGAHVAHAVGPEPAVAGAEQHDGAFGNRSVRGLPGLEVGHLNLVVPIGQRFFRHVDHHGWPHELREWDLIHTPLALGKVHGRVDVRAAVLGRAEGVRFVVVAGLRVAPVVDAELEASAVGQ